MKQLSSKIFWQLMTVYVILIIAIAFDYMHKYTLYFNFFALIIAIFGILSIKGKYLNDSSKDQLKHEDLIPKTSHIILFIFAITLIILLRIIPYWNNLIPIGYDAGLYKYAIEHGLQNLDNWIVSGMEPGFLYFMTFLNKFISTNTLLIHIFILFNVLLGISIYFFSRQYFNKDVAILSLLIYSLSAIQFKVFTYLYYKNIIALSLLLFSFYFLKKENYPAFVLLGILIGITHRPTFYIFGLSYLFYALTSPYLFKKYNLKRLFLNLVNGFIILNITALFYLGTFRPAILSLIFPLINSFFETGTAPGTFITFFSYQFSILFYLPLALIGLFYLISSKKIDIFFFYTIITLIIVYFQFFFFNRFIIFLDISFIILSALGFYILIQEKRKLGITFLTLLLLSGLIMIFNNSINTPQILSQEIFNSISSIDLPSNAYIISISSQFSPYLQGFTKSNNKVIAPGMFDYDIWKTQERWDKFWQDLDASELKSRYAQDIYLFTPAEINNTCYSQHFKNLYRWSC